MSEMKRTVNALPSKTWYWLKMNDAVLPWEEEGGSETIQVGSKMHRYFAGIRRKL